MSKYKNPSLTVDGIFYDSSNRALLLIKRKNNPFKDTWALPGGFVDYGETVENACRREMKEETGLFPENIRLFGVYSEPDRDPRGHTVSIVYFIPWNDFSEARAADDAKQLEIFNVSSLERIRLAFDHEKIISDFLSYLP